MEVLQIAHILALLSPATLIIGIVVGIVLYNRLDKLHKSITAYLILMLCVDLLSRNIKYVLGNNLIILPLYSLIELGFFVYFYNKYLFTKSNKFLIGVGIAGGIYIIAEIFLYFVFNTLDVKQFQPYCKVIDNFIIIIMALLFFKQKISNFKELGWGNFRLNIVLLIFFTLNTIIFLPFNFLINGNSEVKFYFWMFHSVTIFLFYIFLIVEIWKNSKISK